MHGVDPTGPSSLVHLADPFGCRFFTTRRAGERGSELRLSTEPPSGDDDLWSAGKLGFAEIRWIQVDVFYFTYAEVLVNPPLCGPRCS